jgi:hypothetical protein
MFKRQEAERRQEERLAQAQQFDQQMHNNSLLMRVNEMGGRPVTASDEYEMDGGQTVRFGGISGVELSPQDAMTVVPSTKASRVLSVGGQRLLLPSLDEQDARAAAVNHRTVLDRARASAEELRQKKQIEEEFAARRLESEGIPLPKNLADRFGLPVGRKVDPRQMDDLMRAEAYSQSIRQAPVSGAPNPSKVSYVVDQSTGNVTPIVPYLDEQGNPQLRSGKPGEGLARPRPRQETGARGAAGRERRLTPAQEADELVGEVLQGTRSPSIDDAITNASQYFKSDPRFTAGRRAQVIQRLRKMKAAGDANPFYQAQPAAAAAGSKIATQAHVQAYAQTKGITPQQALEEFKQSGYTVQ